MEGPKDEPYLNQHVFNGKYSYFGKLLTRKLTKIINVPVFKNTGNAVSMATKNIGYGAVCNTNRLHQPLFLDVCVEVPAFPAVRDKLVLNVTDGIKAQYEGGPGPEAKFIYDYGTLFFGTDPFALDLVCHTLIVEKRKAMGVKVNEHPRFTEYFRYAQKLGLGVGRPRKDRTRQGLISAFVKRPAMLKRKLIAALRGRHRRRVAQRGDRRSPRQLRPRLGKVRSPAGIPRQSAFRPHRRRGGAFPGIRFQEALPPAL